MGSRESPTRRTHGLEVRPEFRAIFEEHFDYVWNTLRQLGARAPDLEDLTHEVFLRVHERLDDYDGARPLKPWLFAFACRVAAGHRRLARHRLEILGAAPEPRDESAGAEESLSLGEDRTLAQAALDAIEVERRAVFVLHELDEVPIPEVASSSRSNRSGAFVRCRAHHRLRRLASAKARGASRKFIDRRVARRGPHRRR